MQTRTRSSLFAFDQSVQLAAIIHYEDLSIYIQPEGRNHEIRIEQVVVLGLHVFIQPERPDPTRDKVTIDVSSGKAWVVYTIVSETSGYGSAFLNDCIQKWARRALGDLQGSPDKEDFLRGCSIHSFCLAL